MSGSQSNVEVEPKRAPASRWFAFLIASVIFGLWLLYTPRGLLGKADAVGYAVCHRIDLRSFQLGLRQLPLCARCTGMYLGVLLALAYYFVRRPKAGRYPSRRLCALLILFAVIWAVDGLNSYLHLVPDMSGGYPPSNTLRLITGALIGICLATLVYPAFNQFAWQEFNREPVLRSFGDLGTLLVFTAGIILLVLTGNPLILYPLALISAFSVVLLLTVVYSTVVMTVLRRENQATQWRQLLVPLFLGWAIAVIQIGIIDLIRFWLTGTWDGFHL